MSEAFPHSLSVEHVPMVNVARALAAPVVIDLRSPSEFSDDHLPGAENQPLFDDASRAMLGMLYARVSPRQAFEHGRGLVEQRIHALVSGIAQAAGWPAPPDDLAQRVHALTEEGLESFDERVQGRVSETPPDPLVVLHCWRGGLRSRSVIALLRALGYSQAVGLIGGYKAYRKHVLESLCSWPEPRALVLRGLTGVGKTLVLHELERLRPGATLDLEGAAEHRSSLLGMVGRRPCSQKTFETRLCQRAARGFLGPMLVEGESRKVGDVIIPVGLWSVMQRGTNVLLEAPVPRRVEVLMEDYLACEADRDLLRRQLEAVERRMTPRCELVTAFDAGRHRELVEMLLEHYYDPLYRHSERGKEYALRVDASEPRAAAQAILNWIDTGNLAAQNAESDSGRS